MKLFTVFPKRTIVITEEQERIIRENSYEDFKDSQSFRFKAVAELAKRGYLFHGTNVQWDEFDSSKIQGGFRGNYGYGAYFTNAAYKCEEHGNDFVILNANSFNIFDLRMKVKSNNIFLEKQRIKEKLESDLIYIERDLDSCRNIRDYDALSQEQKTTKEKLKNLFANSNEELIFTAAMKIVKDNPDIDYKDLNAIIRNQYRQDKTLSEFFLHMGYDGFRYGTEFVIFNFDKLNQNIVKDKNKLIDSVL